MSLVSPNAAVPNAAVWQNSCLGFPKCVKMHGLQYDVIQSLSKWRASNLCQLSTADLVLH